MKVKSLVISVILGSTIFSSSLYADAAFDLGTQIGSGLGVLSKHGTQASSDSTSKNDTPDYQMTSKDVKIKQFVTCNINKLAYDASNGQGSSIDALAVLMNTNKESLGTKMQSNFESIFPSEKTTSDHVVRTLKIL